MKKYLIALYREDKNTRQQKIVVLLIALFVFSIFTDLTWNALMIPLGIIRTVLGFLFFTSFAIYVYQLLMARENMHSSARYVAIVIAFITVQWVGGFGSLSFHFIDFRFVEILALIYGGFLVHQVILEETEKTPMKDQRYTPPVYRTTSQINTDMTPKKHVAQATEASTTGATSWYCPSCGEKILQKTKRCPHCKEKVEFFD